MKEGARLRYMRKIMKHCGCAFCFMCIDVGQLYFSFLLEVVQMRMSCWDHHKKLWSQCESVSKIILSWSLRSTSKSSISVFYIFYVKNGKICGKTMKRRAEVNFYGFKIAEFHWIFKVYVYILNRIIILQPNNRSA